MKFPTIEEMARDVAEKALDEYEYKGKTLRQWIEIISASELSTNLAEVGTDCISREQAIDALGELPTFTQDWSYNTWMYTDDVYNAIKELPPIQPDNNLQKLADEIASFKRCVKSENSDYLTGYLCALSVVEGMIADMRGKQDG